MTKRAAQFASAIAASFLAGAPFATPSHSAAADCLSGPKNQTPQGSHWYYRVDHSTQRHCWYLGDEREKTSQTSASDSSSGKASAQRAENAMPRAIADAHAELPAASTIEQPKQDAQKIPPALTSAEAKTPAENIQPSIIASRWPDQALPTASVQPLLNKANPNVAAAADVNPTRKMQMASIQDVEPLATADLSSQTQGYSLQLLLAAMAGTLALAGIFAGLFLKFGNTRATAWAPVREWPEHQTGFARDAHPARDRASEFFAQISRRHPL